MTLPLSSLPVAKGAQMARVLTRLLGAQQMEVSAQAILEQGGSGMGVHEASELLARYGVAARVVSVQGAEVSALSMPTLIVHEGQEPCLALSIDRRGRVRVQREHGQVELVALSREAELVALDMSPVLPARQGIVARALAAIVARRSDLSGVVALSALLLGLSLCAPWLTRTIMDRALPHAATNLLGALALAMALLALLRTALRGLRDRAVRSLGVELEVATRRSLLAQLVRLPFARQQKQSLGSALLTLRSGALVTSTLLNLLSGTLIDALLALGNLTVLAFLLPGLALALSGVVFLCSLASLLAANRQARFERREAAASAQQSEALYELLSGATTLKAVGAERRGIARWLGRFLQQQAFALSRARMMLWFQLVFGTLRQLASLLALFLCAKRCLEGELSLGELMAATVYAEGFMSAALGTVNNFASLYSLRVHAERVHEVLGTDAPPSAVASGPRPASQRSLGPPDVVLRDVWFRYDESLPWALEGLNLEVRSGTVQRIHSPSGSGKTTALRLIAGLLSPQRGEVLIGGRTAAQAQDLVAYLPQEPRLFGGSLRYNLTLLSGASFAEVQRAAVRTGLSSWVEQLPMGWDTVLPPGGLNLSGGQRQLVLLTAALASPKPVLLLDEGFAHLDPITRRLLDDNALFRDKTVVCVSHESVLRLE